MITRRKSRRALGALLLVLAGLLGLLGLVMAGPASAGSSIGTSSSAGTSISTDASIKAAQLREHSAIPVVQPLSRAYRRTPDGTKEDTCSIASVTTPTTSNCWSGYVQQRSPVNTVSASWTVPTVYSSSTSSSATWIGVDGWNSSSLIQTGTTQGWDNSTHKLIYYAWWEVLPAYETQVFAVSPGDSIYATITHGSGTQWAIYLVDLTNHQSLSTTQPYTGGAGAADFIQEAPTSGGNVVTLATDTAVPFYNAYVNGMSAGLKASQEVTMVQNGTQVETPSVPNEASNGFTMAYGAGGGNPPSTPVFQIHNSDKSVWASLGGACTSATSCTDWYKLDGNANTTAIAAGAGTVFERHSDGSIWQWTGTPCTGAGCLGWEELDNNPATASISAGSGTVFQQHSDGSIWRSTGFGCRGSSCPGWVELDNNSKAAQISAGNGTVYERRSDGTIWRSNGSACASSTSCTGMIEIGNNTATASITAGATSVYERYGNGQIYRSTGAACASSTSCTGWTLLDNNAATTAFAAGGSTVYQLHSDHSIYRSTGAACTSTTSCTGWQQLDGNAGTAQIVASSSVAYQRHTDGSIWRSTGAACTSATSCPGWQQLDGNADTSGITISNGS